MIEAIGKTIDAFGRMSDFIIIKYREGDVTVIHRTGFVSGTFLGKTIAVDSNDIIKFEILPPNEDGGNPVLVMQKKQDQPDQEKHVAWVVGYFDNSVPESARTLVEEINLLYASS